MRFIAYSGSVSCLPLRMKLRSIAFTMPAALLLPNCFARFTDSFTAALSGTLSMYIIWYIPHRNIFTISSSSLFIGREDSPEMMWSRVILRSMTP